MPKFKLKIQAERFITVSATIRSFGRTVSAGFRYEKHPINDEMHCVEYLEEIEEKPEDDASE